MLTHARITAGSRFGLASLRLPHGGPPRLRNRMAEVQRRAAVSQRGRWAASGCAGLAHYSRVAHTRVVLVGFT
jgi:hypothetical protein